MKYLSPSAPQPVRAPVEKTPLALSPSRVSEEEELRPSEVRVAESVDSCSPRSSLGQLLHAEAMGTPAWLGALPSVGDVKAKRREQLDALEADAARLTLLRETEAEVARQQAQMEAQAEGVRAQLEALAVKIVVIRVYKK